MMGSNELWDGWQKKNLPFHSFPLPPSLLYSVTHTHTNSYTSRNRGSNSLTEYRSPHVDNVTFSAFHYLVLTIRELPLTFFSPPTSRCVTLCLFWNQWDVLRATVILCNCRSDGAGGNIAIASSHLGSEEALRSVNVWALNCAQRKCCHAAGKFWRLGHF